MRLFSVEVRAGPQEEPHSHIDLEPSGEMTFAD